MLLQDKSLWENFLRNSTGEEVEEFDPKAVNSYLLD
jgi:hypothetical protein